MGVMKIVVALNAKVRSLAVLMAMLCTMSVAVAQEHDAVSHAAHEKLGLATNVVFDANGRLWRVSSADEHVIVQYSDDKGRRFSAPVKVNAEPENIAADGDNRPKIALASNGAVYVSYTVHLPQPYAGHIRLSRSIDGGRNFSAPITVNDDRAAISHRFESFLLDAQGKVHVVWIDKRDQAAAGKQYAGAALYYATSTDATHVTSNRKLVDHGCECCRIAMALDTDGVPVIVWRHIFGKSARDHALQRLDDRSTLIRVAEDDWEIDACPHHGPTLAVASDGTYHVAWFTNSAKRQGLFYARSTDRATFDAPMPFGDLQAQPGHPALWVRGQNIYLAWKEFDGTRSAVRLMRSTDGGRRWSATQTIATAQSGNDYPLLVADGKTVYVSWNAQREGYRLIPLDEKVASR